MEPTPPQDLSERVAHLEAQVAWLLQGQRTPSAPAPPVLAPRLTVPRVPLSPVAWIAGIGGAIFLLGAAFFLTWAAQQGWLGPGTRFALGLLAGGGITAWAARLLPGEGRRLGTALLLAGLGTLQFTCRAGALTYHFYPASAGLLAMALVTLGAGALAVRAACGGALTVALVSALAAPLAFGQGGHHEVGLALYLVVLLTAALLVPFRAPVAATWVGARWTALLGTGLLWPITCGTALRPDVPALSALLALHLLLAGLWVWLPRVPALPSTPTALWFVGHLLATATAWVLWHKTLLSPEAFALLLVAAAGLNLALVAPLQRRMKAEAADWGLLALAAGHLALAVPVALDERWVGSLWGIFALALAWASAQVADGARRADAPVLRGIAVALALLTTARWALHLPWAPAGQAAGQTPFLNPAFLEGLLTAGSWGLLARPSGRLRPLAFVALELTANLTLALEAARAVQALRGPASGGALFSREASVAMTLTWAASGAWQWMRSLGQPKGGWALAVAGYVLMAAASLKLIAVDLDRADTPLRALASLAVGGMGMAAAILAHRRRQRVSPAQPQEPLAGAAPGPPPPG